MTRSDLLPAWGQLLRGRRPLLSMGTTKARPLRCPGCYAYESNHVPPGVGLQQLADYHGLELVDRVLDLIGQYPPLHISIVGVEPLVRYREFDVLLQTLYSARIEVQLVTSSVGPIPTYRHKLRGLHIVVSIDGFRSERDRRRSPATYAPLLENIASHKITTNCTIARQLLSRPGYLRGFCEFWSARPETRKIWFSLFTPQETQLSAEDRARSFLEIAQLRTEYAKVEMPQAVLDGFLRPPESPRGRIFAQVTACLSSDLATVVGKLGGLVPVSTIFAFSTSIGSRVGATELLRK